MTMGEIIGRIVLLLKSLWTLVALWNSTVFVAAVQILASGQRRLVNETDPERTRKRTGGLLHVFSIS